MLLRTYVNKKLRHKVKQKVKHSYRIKRQVGTTLYLFSLYILYCNGLSTQFTVFYINSYSIISMRRHYFQKIKSICEILLNYLFKILLYIYSVMMG